MSETGEATRWAALDLDTLSFDDTVDRFDLDTLPRPGSAGVQLIVDVDPELLASLNQEARVKGVSLEDVIRRRLRDAA